MAGSQSFHAVNYFLLTLRAMKAHAMFRLQSECTLGQRSTFRNQCDHFRINLIDLMTDPAQPVSERRGAISIDPGVSGLHARQHGITPPACCIAMTCINFPAGGLSYGRGTRYGDTPMYPKHTVRKPRSAEHASPARRLALKAIHFSANGFAAPLFEKMLSVFVNQAFSIPMARGDLDFL
ncbi:MAG TPA: hypothetical protein VNF46_00225, partial [Gammaproteobacteria bacterium]|nr:hypothetical protein [Gammaproteobacteria bacterium]